MGRNYRAHAFPILDDLASDAPFCEIPTSPLIIKGRIAAHAKRTHDVKDEYAIYRMHATLSTQDRELAGIRPPAMQPPGRADL